MRERYEDAALRFVCAAAAAVPVAVLLLLVSAVVWTGLDRFGWDFVTSFPSRDPERAGVAPGLVGSVWLAVVAAAFAMPVGVAASVYLEELAPPTRMTRWIELNIANLAGVPSVVYGMLGLAIFVHALGMGRSVLAGGLTLGILVLPIVVVTSREALRAVPGSLREASLGLGATQLATIRKVVLPAALPGVLTGSILALSRAIGETAPIVVVGAQAYMTFVPDGPNAPFSALPVIIFGWASRPQASFEASAAAGVMLLLLVVLAINAGAILVRDRLRVSREL